MRTHRRALFALAISVLLASCGTSAPPDNSSTNSDKTAAPISLSDTTTAPNPVPLCRDRYRSRITTTLASDIALALGVPADSSRFERMRILTAHKHFEVYWCRKWEQQKLLDSSGRRIGGLTEWQASELRLAIPAASTNSAPIQPVEPQPLPNPSPPPDVTNIFPDGTSAECADGTFSYSQHRRGTCSYHGGVSIWNPAADIPD